MPGTSPVTDYQLRDIDAVTAVTPWLSSEDVDRLIGTPTYRAAPRMPPDQVGPRIGNAGRFGGVERTEHRRGSAHVPVRPSRAEHRR
jgi:hypothetical protein